MIKGDVKFFTKGPVYPDSEGLPGDHCFLRVCYHNLCHFCAHLYVSNSDLMTVYKVLR